MLIIFKLRNYQREKIRINLTFENGIEKFSILENPNLTKIVEMRGATRE